tara:strand:+ start:127475 stop:128071 length:597 start_codon:yes stop_codon:yes gene_type:complete
MKKEINYHKFANFLIDKLENKEQSEIKKSIAANIIVNWDSLCYYGHSKYNLTLNEISNHSLHNDELTFEILEYLKSENIVKKTPIKCSQTKNIFTVYTVTENFKYIKNDYIHRHEKNWIGFESWLENFQIYIENNQFFEEIEGSFKYFSSVYDLDEDSLVKAQQIKSDYIVKIATEKSYDIRFALKEEVIFKLERFFQ